MLLAAALAFSMAALTLPGAAVAAELPTLKVKAIGLNGSTVVSSRDEVPFWTKTVPEASGGKITADIVPVDRSGIKDFQMMRMGKLGVTDFGAGDISKMAGDDAVFEGCDLAGLTLSPEQARAACEAWKPMLAKAMSVSSHLYPLSLGWSINYQSVSEGSWNKWPPEARTFFLGQFDKFEDKMWETVGIATSEGMTCNVNKQPCTIGKLVNMTIVPVSDADQALRKELMESTVLVSWGKRCGKPCVEEWNKTVGKVVGLTIPVDKI
jgi:TRAP-type C4-dicarboxylate transport system substrate-binding protein